MNPGQKKYLDKKYCRTCRVWRWNFETHKGPRGALCCNVCDEKVRTRPRATKSHKNYIEEVPRL